MCSLVAYSWDYPKNPLSHKFDKENIFGDHKSSSAIKKSRRIYAFMFGRFPTKTENLYCWMNFITGWNIFRHSEFLLLGTSGWS